MARLNALKLADALKDRLVDFSLSDNYIRDERVQQACRKIWCGRPSEGGLCSEIWVEGSTPSKSSGQSLEELAEEGYFSSWLANHLHKRGVFPKDRPLYWHQRESLVACQGGGEGRPGVILSAGTGAGKTEAFLLPILTDLLRTKRKPATGCRVIILYPMNALVNDQVDRLYGWLRGQKKLTVCHFTSETPEDWRWAEKDQFPRFEACRHRTRQRARGLEAATGQAIKPENRAEPPDVLITNYSMLEYMLCRPQDRVFFGPGLRAVVLDEAHLYTGTLAAEMTLLLRRLYDKSEVKPSEVMQFATSATIGRGTPGELEDFASTLFSKSNIVVIQGEKADSGLPVEAPPKVPPSPECFGSAPFDRGTIQMSQDGKEELLRSAEGCDHLVPLLQKLVDSTRVEQARRDCEDYPARLLKVLGHAPLVHSLEALLRGTSTKPTQVALDELAEKVWGRRGSDAERGTAALLSLAAAARHQLEDVPLLPHRLHLMLRPVDGLSVCCNPACEVPEELRYPGAGQLLPGRQEQCPGCRHHCLTLCRCRECGEPLLGLPPGGSLRPLKPFESVDQFLTFSEDAGPHTSTLCSQRGCLGGSTRVTRTNLCPHCDGSAEGIRPLFSATNLVLSILAETLLAHLPPLACQYESSNRILPARGRRLLAFSDSRREAARLGPRLRRQHDIQMIRAALVKLFASQPDADEKNLQWLGANIQRLEQDLNEGRIPGAFAEQEQARLERLREELRAATSGGSVKHWAALLATDQVLEQILDDDLGERHEASRWNQDAWDRNRTAVRDKSMLILAREFARLPGRYRLSVETIGCAEVVYPGIDEVLEPPPSLLGKLPTEASRLAVREHWAGMVSALCDTLRADSAVTLGDPAEDEVWQQDRAPIGQWCTRTEFRGATERHKRRRFVRELLSRVDVDGDEADGIAEEILVSVFEQLLGRARPFEETTFQPGTFLWLETRERIPENRAPEPGVRIIFPELALRKPRQLFLCQKTGHAWTRSVLGCAPARESCGTLHPITPQQLDETPWVGRARREYASDSLVFSIGLWAEEHSAQLSPGETRRLQELFRLGIRNLLSATTTLELGIDIGGLSGAFLSNVPPGKANYLQRAGRVGRRADGSSVVVTCARTRPYDREVFQRIGVFLQRDLRQPKVFLERERIARRHFHSWLMGRFFEQLYSPDQHVGAMEAFGRMGLFCGKVFPNRWERGVNRRPPLPRPESPLAKDFTRPSWWDPEAGNGLAPQFECWLRAAEKGGFEDVLDTLFHGTAFEARQKRCRLFQDAIDQFHNALSNWNKDYDHLLEAWKKAKTGRQANAIRYQLMTLYRLTVIEALSDARFLPRYGFPIGVHKLRVISSDKDGRAREEDQYRLQRSSLLALREYVPGSQLLVGGKLITSRGLLKHWTGANVDSAFGLRGGYTKCRNEHFFYWHSERLDVCPVCEAPPASPVQDLLFPQHGFTTAAWEPPKRSTDTDDVGRVVAATTAFASRGNGANPREMKDFAGVTGLEATYLEEGEILVFNAGEDNYGFALCTGCGYADSEKKPGADAELPRRFKDHRPLYQEAKNRTTCWEINKQRDPLRHQVLAAREPTDILRLDLSRFLEGRLNQDQLARSLAVALHLAGARLLQLDSRELGHMVVPAGPSGMSLGAVVYDNVPGGAGHVLELMHSGPEWLEETRKLLRGTDEHHDRCLRACLDCLMTFDAQAHFVNPEAPLDRRLGLKFLEEMLGLGGGPQVTDDEELPPPGEPGEEGEAVPIYDLKALAGDQPRPSDWRKLNQELSPDHFLVRFDSDALDRKQVPRGSWCLFRRLKSKEEIPNDAIVAVQDPRVQDPEFGNLTVRRMRHLTMDPPMVVVRLLSKSSRREDYRQIVLELSLDEWEHWHPLAVLVKTYVGAAR